MIWKWIIFIESDSAVRTNITSSLVVKNTRIQAQKRMMNLSQLIFFDSDRKRSTIWTGTSFFFFRRTLMTRVLLIRQEERCSMSSWERLRTSDIISLVRDKLPLLSHECVSKNILIRKDFFMEKMGINWPYNNLKVDMISTLWFLKAFKNPTII